MDYSAPLKCHSLSKTTTESNKSNQKTIKKDLLLSVSYKPCCKLCQPSRRVSCCRLDAALTMVLPVQSNSASSTKPRLSNKSWKSFRRYSQSGVSKKSSRRTQRRYVAISSVTKSARYIEIQSFTQLCLNHMFARIIACRQTTQHYIKDPTFVLNP